MTAVSIVKPGTHTITAYLGLTKPGGIIPHLITASAGMFLAAKGLPPAALLGYTLLGGALSVAAANTLNSFFDRDIDKLMPRTRGRPLPSGQVKPGYALAFGLAAGVSGTIILAAMVNWTAAALAVFAVLYYVLFYTLWLKRRSYWGAVIGSGIGAIPPLIGWSAVSHLTVIPLILSAIVILWTIPHFWSLALIRRRDYELAGLTVLPPRGTILGIKLCSISLAALSIVLAQFTDLQAIYLAGASLLAIVLLYYSLRLNPGNLTISGKILYRFSIVYIAGLFIFMIIDRGIFR